MPGCSAGGMDGWRKKPTRRVHKNAKKAATFSLDYSSRAERAFGARARARSLNLLPPVTVRRCDGVPCCTTTWLTAEQSKMSAASPPSSQPNSPLAGPQSSLGALRKTLMAHVGGHHAVSADKPEPSPFNSCVIRVRARVRIFSSSHPAVT